MPGETRVAVYRKAGGGQPRPAALKPAAFLDVDVMPIRYIPIHLWYLDDPDSATDTPPADFLNATNFLELLNLAGRQACVQFLYYEDAAPAFKPLTVKYGHEGRFGPELNLIDERPTGEMAPLMAPTIGQQAIDTKAVHVIVVRYANYWPARPIKHGPNNIELPSGHPLGITYQSGITNRCFVQTSDLERRINPTVGAKQTFSKEVIVRDFMTTAIHEVGHILGLSVRAPDAAPPFNFHDNGTTPETIFCRDGTPVDRGLIFAPIESEIDLYALEILPWSKTHNRKKLPTHHTVNNERKPYEDKRRISVALMAQSGDESSVAPPGAAIRSLWIRHEDWRKMNGNAKRLEIE